MANLAPSWRPKTLQNRGRNPKKSMLKNDTFSTSIFKGFRPRFWRVFERFLKRKIDAFGKCAFFAKTWKISILLGENQYFQDFEDNKNAKTIVKNLEKIDVFWNLDFEGILGRFWEGFGRPKSLIFALFSMFFRSRFWSAFRKAKKSTKNAKKPNFSAFWRRVCGVRDVPGEGL